MQGRSLLPLTRNQTEDWPLDSYIQFGDRNMAPGRALRTRRWKYSVVGPEKGVGDAKHYTETELYDLQTDPYELANLIVTGPHQPIRDELRARLLTWMQQVEGFQAEIIPAEMEDNPATQRAVDYP